ncbi:MAG: ISAs1 family transposase [Nitrospiraceae bacterium]
MPAESPPVCFDPPGDCTAPLLVRPVLTREQPVWRWWLQRHHYLGYRPLVGESIGYVAFWQRQAVGVLGWASATLHNAARDRFIGWDAATKRRRLHLVVSNVRFLMLPQACASHLASRILAANLRRLSGDWQASYGHPVWLVETFVDGRRFRGTCYRASNWIDIGQSRGWSRSGFQYRRNHHPKTVFVYPLVRRAVERLRDREEGRVAVAGQEEKMLDAEKLPVAGEGGLIEVLRQIPDPRKRRGIRHSSESVLALATCAKLCGARSLEAMAQWAEDLPAETLKQLGCRRGRAPSEPTFRRLLGRIDPAELDRRLGEWTARQTELQGKGLAIDGKTVRGSKDGEQPAVHLVGAVVHGEGLVVAQTRVSDKTNEITSVEPLLKNLDIKGAVVTGDAIFTQKQIASYLVEQKKADYLFAVKDNQPTLKSDIEQLGLEAFPPSGEDDR